MISRYDNGRRLERVLIAAKPLTRLCSVDYIAVSSKNLPRIVGMLDSVITEETRAKMAFETRTPSIARFGTFEVDLRTGELRKQGKRLKLQDQPFQVLVALLQRPGDVVTREELRSQIWPEDTFVDFDNSLNTAINKLREALGDSADNPRFIETLPRRGYRFLVPVTSPDRKESATVRPLAASRAARWKVMLPVAVVVVIAVAGGMFWSSRKARKLTDRDTIVLGDFANSTGDSVFDGTLREGLSVQLEQSPFLSLVSEEGIRQTLRMMGQPINARLTPEITREVCQRTNSTAALDGSIALIGTRYNLIVKVVNCANGAVLTSTESQANEKSHVLDALSKAASDMRTKLGESLGTIHKYNTPLEQATTPSLEALQAYNSGLQAFFGQGDNAGALSFFQQATRLDPNFAMAYWAMAQPYSYLGETALSVESSRKAFALREKLSELEKLRIECDYEWDVIEAIRTCELGAKTFPRDPVFHWELGMDENQVGWYEAGLKERLETVRLAPYDGIYHRGVVATYLHLNRVEEAEAAAKEAQAKGPDASLVSILYQIAFYMSDSAEMARQLAGVADQPAYEDLLLALEADSAAYFGLLGKARGLSRRAVDSAEVAGEREAAAGYRAVSTLREALFGNGAKVRQQATVAKSPPTWRDARYAAALAFAYERDVSQAQALAEDMVKSFSRDTLVQVNYLPTLRAKLALLHSNPKQALDILTLATPYELGLPSLSLYNWPNMYPVYVRGEAYLAAHQGREAAAEFQKILDHRGIVLNEPIGALAHLQLGRAYAMQGDTIKARTAYQDFLTLWKDADPDIPILIAAKAEYAKLQ